MKIIVFGSSGLVGSYVCRLLEKEHQVIKVSRSSGDYSIDASDFEKVSGIIEKEKPDVVINTIKSSLSTDQSEIQKDKTWNANVLVPQNLAKLQSKYGFYFIHISSDWVFEGKEGEIYTENSPLNPQNYYSQTKVDAEEKIKEFATDYLILRPTGIFGIDSRNANFFMRLKSAMEQNNEITVPSDQYSQPIYAGELARIIQTAIEKKSKGIYNAVGKDYVSRYELAILICDVFGWNKSLIKKGQSTARSIKIPMNLKVDISKLEKEVTYVKPLKQQIIELGEEIKWMNISKEKS